MFERFKEETIRVIMLTQDEARRFGNTRWIGTEFLLLGLVAETDGIAGKALRAVDLTLEQARDEVEKMIGRGSGVPAVEIPFSKNAEAVLEQSLKEAQQLGHKIIGTEHLLLAIVALERGRAYQILEILQVDIEQLQSEVLAAMTD